MKILHLSQAINPKSFYGGAELSESTLIADGITREHEIISINARGEVYEWNNNVAGTIGYDGFLMLVDWCDAIWVGNCEWFLPELMFDVIERARGSKPIYYHPRHFNPCIKIGLSGTYKEICQLECGGIYACSNTYRWEFYKYLIQNSTKVIYTSPLQQSFFYDAYGDDVDLGCFDFAPPIIGDEYKNEDLPRIFDAVCVGGGTRQKGLENHIKWAKENPDRTLTLYGRIETQPTKPIKLPKNLKYEGVVNNASLPDILNLYETFVYYPKCEESYSRTVAEADLCGCKLDIDGEKIGLVSFVKTTQEIQEEFEGAFWNILEQPVKIPYSIAFEAVSEKKVEDMGFNPIAVVVSAHNQNRYTTECLNSLDNSDLPYDSIVVLVDDGSTDSTKRLTKKKAKELWPNLNIKIIRNKEPENCTAAWNKAIEYLKKNKIYYEYLVIANNDTIFPTGWAISLIGDASLYGADIIGPMSNCPGNRPAQEIDRLYAQNMEKPYILSNKYEDIENTQKSLECAGLLPIQVSAVNGFCMMISSIAVDSLVSKFGYVFNPSIESFGNEDELQQRMMREGMTSFVSRRSFVFHYGNVTYDDRTNRGKVREDILAVRAKGIDESYETLTDALDNNKRVFFLRFGDGEIAMMEGSGIDTTNINKMEATEGMRRESAESFKIHDPNYLRAVSVNYPRDKGMVDGLFAPFPYNEALVKAIQTVDPSDENTIYENPVLFHYLAVFRPKQFVDFLDKYIRPKSKVFVGSQPTEAMEKLIGKIDYHVQTPAFNSYANIDEIWEDLLHATKKYSPSVIIMATGQTSNILQKRLWEDTNIKTHCIDIGSVVDAVTGDKTRTWIKMAGDRIKECLLSE